MKSTKSDAWGKEGKTKELKSNLLFTCFLNNQGGEERNLFNTRLDSIT